MQLGLVLGTATSTIKHPTFQGERLLVVQLEGERRPGRRRAGPGLRPAGGGAGRPGHGDERRPGLAGAAGPDDARPLERPGAARPMTRARADRSDGRRAADPGGRCAGPSWPSGSARTGDVVRGRAVRRPSPVAPARRGAAGRDARGPDRAGDGRHSPGPRPPEAAGDRRAARLRAGRPAQRERGRVGIRDRGRVRRDPGPCGGSCWRAIEPGSSSGRTSIEAARWVVRGAGAGRGGLDAPRRRSRPGGRARSPGSGPSRSRRPTRWPGPCGTWGRTCSWSSRPGSRSPAPAPLLDLSPGRGPDAPAWTRQEGHRP